MFIQNNQLSFSFSNLELIFDFSPQNKLIALAFLVIMLVTNLYAISQNRKAILLLGTLYCFSSISCLFAGDFISMIVALEFMNIFACLLILYSEYPFIGSNIKFVHQYFLTHLFSSSLILMGISLIITRTGNNAIIPLTDLVYNHDIAALLILAGCLINIGVIFFNGWIVNCYSAASTSALVYLISFTTKTMAIVILKLFSGLEILSFFGGSMIIYGILYALIELEIKRLIFYLTISQLGFILIAISKNSPEAMYLVTAFIFVHLLYNGLFVLYFAFIEDHRKSILLLSGFIASILISTGLLPIASSDIKAAMINILDDRYHILILFKLANCAILFRIFLENCSSSSLSLKNPKFLAITSFFIMLVITIAVCLFLPQILSSSWLFFIWPNYPGEIFNISSSNILNQGIIALASVILALILRKTPKISTSDINLDLFQWIKKIIHKFTCKEIIGNIQEEESYFDFKIIFNKTLNKISTWHNQQISIFIVVILLITLLTTILGI